MKKLLCVLALAVATALPVCAKASVDTAQSYCVINGATGEIVSEKNADQRMPMASTTKIMTAYTALKNSKLDDIVTVSQNAQNQEGSGMYIEAGSKFYMEDLLYGLMLNSGNDAAVAIAEYIGGGSCEKFVDMMNKEAWVLGAGDTMFCNPNGLPSPSHYTTAKNLAEITRNAMQLSEFRKIVATKDRTVWQAPQQNVDGMSVIPEKSYILHNHNRLLSTYDGAIGVKTGYTEAAGRCLVSAAERDGMMFIAVTLNDNDDWNTHTQLLDEAFKKYHPGVLAKKGEIIKEIEIDGNKYTFSAADDCVIPLKNNEKNRVIADVHLADRLNIPINKGEKVGYVEYGCGGKVYARVDVISDNEIRTAGKYRLKNSFYELWKNVWDFFLV